jgi:hypothetical protein
MVLCAMRWSFQNSGFALTASNSAICASLPGKSKTHPDPVDALAQFPQGGRQWGAHGYSTTSLRRASLPTPHTV